MEKLKNFVDQGTVPGYVAVIEHDGKLKIEACGTRTEGGEPLKESDLFRITSMTKPITAVATLRLMEHGKLMLNDPIEKWLPEMVNRRVLKRVDGAVDDTVPSNRPITVDDVLSFRMGFGMVMDPSRKYSIVEAFEEKLPIGLWQPDPCAKISHEEWLTRFSKLPLMYQPGERWQYNTAYYLLGILLEKVAGKKLDLLLEELVFAPLGMKDTSFKVPESKTNRLTDCYYFDSSADALQLADHAEDSDWSFNPNFIDAAAGLVSSAPDYLAFARMLLGEGRHDGKAFLSRESVRLMTSDHLTPAQHALPTFAPDQWKYHGYGYGVSVVTLQSKKNPGKEGAYGWNGGFGSTWMNDPKSRSIGILLTERTFDSPALPPICEAFWGEVEKYPS